MRRALVVAACILGAWSASATAATTLNVIPHGQFEPGVPWAGAPGLLPAETQANMYNRLTPLFRDVTDAQLQPSTDGTGYYKSSAFLDQNDPSFVASEVVSGTSPSAGPVTATIKRDNYGVPHIYSDTDAGVVFGAGRVVAEDRSLLIDQARFNGVAGLIDMPGVPAIQLVLGLYNYKPSKKIVDEVTAQQNASIAAEGADGKRLLNDIDTYVAGINTWYSEHEPTAPPVTRTDIYALNAVKAQFLGQGGGEEIAQRQPARRTAPQARLHARDGGLRGPARAQRPRDGDHHDEEVPVADRRQRRQAQGRREPRQRLRSARAARRCRARRARAPRPRRSTIRTAPSRRPATS